MISRKQVLVLGGTGFIGKTLVEMLVADDRFGKIRVMSRSNISITGAEHIIGDIRNYDWKKLESDLPDVIIHLARIPGRHKISRWYAGLQGKKASERMLKWLTKLERPPHIVFVSGTLVYGDCGDLPIDEESSLNPTAFQRDYVKAEYPFLNHLKGNHKPRVSVARAPWVCGDGSWFEQFYYKEARSSGTIMRIKDTNPWMSLIHTKDCAGQISEIASGNTQSGIYNLCGIEPVQYQDFIDEAAKILDCSFREITSAQIRSKYGKTVHEALTFSVNLQSNQKLIQSYSLNYDSLNSIISDAVAKLKKR
ncbi:MAG: NAD(P)-dependent oxidoreductase [Balneolales bacterium]|nr:NAD(P)-dependent oxidoreductase [Balneolales bacterium]